VCRTANALRGVVFQAAQALQRIGGSIGRCLVDPSLVQRLVGVRQDIAKPSRAHQTVGERRLDGHGVLGEHWPVDKAHGRNACHCVRAAGDAIRIISARKANRAERGTYTDRLER